MPELLEAQILKEYVGYVAGRMELNTWIDSAVEKMNSLRKLNPLSEMYQLLQANIYLREAASKRQSGSWKTIIITGLRSEKIRLPIAIICI